jgi:hypothetical protein
MRVKIKLKGHLGKEWESWFNNLEIEHEGENTTLSGEIPDEAALHGILNQIRDLNLKLISVNPVQDDNNN